LPLRILVTGALAVGLAGAADLPKLCVLLPEGHNLTTPYLDTPVRRRSAVDLAPAQVVCGQPAQCVAGTGELTRGAGYGSGGLRILISMYKSPAEARGAMGRYGGKPNSGDYGDAAIAGTLPNPQISEVMFTWGPYYVEVYGLGTFAARVVPMARQIDAAVKRLDAGGTCGAATAGPAKPEIPTTGMPSRRVETAGAGRAAACFPSDPSAALLDPERHRGMAAGAPPEAISHGLSTRLRTISGCSQISANQWSSLYATISVAVAKRFRDARCFANDTAAINPDWNFHKSQRAPRNSVDDLIFKTDQAVNCMPAAERPAFFAEAAAAIAASLER
jgi:hypothetical protein